MSPPANSAQSVTRSRAGSARGLHLVVDAFGDNVAALVDIHFGIVLFDRLPAVGSGPVAIRLRVCGIDDFIGVSLLDTPTRAMLVAGDLALNTCDFSSPPAQPALYQHRDMEFLKACALRRTILAETFRLLASLVSPEGHTKCTRSTPIQLSTQLAPALCPTDCYRRGAPDTANKRQTKITVTALSASQIARMLIFGSWRIEQQQSKRSGE